MEFGNPYYYQQGVVLNRPVQQRVVQQQQPYYNGNTLKIKLRQYDLFPGQVAEGTIILNNPGAMLINDIYLHLVYIESWKVQGETIIAELNEKILGSICIGIAKILKINGALINLNPGVFNFPFQFKIPENIPPCFEFPKNSVKGYIRYTFKANLYSQYTKGEGSVSLFVKARPKIYKAPLVSSDTQHMKKMGMFDQGLTTIQVTLKGTSYLIKGKIPVSVEIDNTQGKAKVKSVVIKLVRRLQLRKVQEFKDRVIQEKVIRSTSYNVNVPPNTKSQILNYDFQIEDATITSFGYSGLSNPYPRLANLFYVMPSVDSVAIKCFYFLVVTLDFTAMISQQYIPKVSFPLHLNHQEMQDYDMEQKETEDLNAAIAASLDDMKKNNDINIVDLKDTNKENNEEQKEDKPIEDDDNNIDNEKEVNEINNHLNNINIKSIDNIMNENEEIKVNNNIENIKNEIKGILNVMASGDVDNSIKNENEENNINNEKEENNINNENEQNNLNIEKEQENNINNEKNEENNINNNKDEENNDNQPKNFSINDDYEEEYDNNINNDNNQNMENNENIENNENMENNEENNKNENENKNEENFSVFNQVDEQ